VVLGDKFNQTVDEICKMGFPKEEAIKALKAAFNNPDRAIDYLINVFLNFLSVLLNIFLGNSRYS